MSVEWNRVRTIWERRDDPLLCTEGDVEVVAVFKMFFMGRGKRLLRGKSSGDLMLNYGQFVTLVRLDVFDFSDMLFSQPARVILQLGVSVDLARAEENTTVVIQPPTKIRFRGVYPLMPLANLRSETVDRFVSVRVTVTRVGPIRPLVKVASYRCAKCSAGAKKDDSLRCQFIDGNYCVPTQCSDGDCKCRRFELKRASAVTVDFQKLKVQQQMDDCVDAEYSAGRVPRSLDIECIGNATVDMCVPGDVIIVAGIVCCINSAVAAGRHDKRALATATSIMYLDANSILNLSREAERNSGQARDTFALVKTSPMVPRAIVDPRCVAHFCPADKALIEQVQNDEDPLALIVGSLVPKIYGHELVKLGLLLGLFGGTNQDGADENCVSYKGPVEPTSDSIKLESISKSLIRNSLAIRSNSHVLVVGDPGLGKSQMLRAAYAIAPRGTYVCGNTTTVTGLTVSLSRDGSSSDTPVLEAGAVVLSDHGMCCIDEFDKMDSGQHSGLLEAMEQQQVSIAKAGVVATLQARCSILAAANPVGGQYDRSKSVSENVKLGTPLLSRFDLVFILIDSPDTAHDSLLSRHVINMHCINGSLERGEKYRSDEQAKGAADDTLLLEKRLRAGSERAARDPLLKTALRKYIAHAKRFCFPKLDLGAAVLLQETYLEMRQEASNAPPGCSMPITTRQLESLVRLAQARAKIEFRNTVTKDDARDVITLLRESVREACTTVTGAVDFSRATSGMSAAKTVRSLVAALHARADTQRDPWFTLLDINTTMRRAGVESTKPILEIIDILRDQSYLMHQKREGGSFCYKLTSCKYGADAERTLD